MSCDNNAFCGAGIFCIFFGLMFFFMLNMKRERLSYPDICKFLAVFIVTWSHCAQRVSGMIWTNFWGGLQFDIAFTMPLFMLMSGWFINPDKMRKVKLRRR
jgi:fucose 4-O-acetylase-like acetyltransferase